MRALMVGAIAALLATPAMAQGSGNVQTGRDLALQLCSGCHFVAPGQRPPAAVQAPPFMMLANDPAMTEFRIRNFLRTPHPIMPTLILAPQEVDDLVAYIGSVRTAKGG